MTKPSMYWEHIARAFPSPGSSRPAPTHRYALADIVHDGMLLPSRYGDRDAVGQPWL